MAKRIHETRKIIDEHTGGIHYGLNTLFAPSNSKLECTTP